MSEEGTPVVDETPPPDVVEQPARARGAYKLCMACGQNVLRPHFRAGASVCKRCEAREQGLPVPESAAVTAAVQAAQGWLATADEPQGAPGEASEAPGQEDAEGLVRGSMDALAWLEAACGARGTSGVTLDQIAATLGSVLEQQTQMIGRVTRQRSLASELRPEDIPLEVAAQALWLACDPILQEALQAAMELLGLSLNQVMLGNLAFSRQELLNQDQSLVPQASLAVQFGTGRGLLTTGQAGRTGLPGGRLVDTSGQLVKDCRCCGREFHPPRDRPNPHYCDDYCGTFADQLRIWATNTVLNELRYPGSTDPAPLPDPRTFWPVERCQEASLRAALTFREQHVAQQMAQAREQQQKMRGL